MCVYVVDIAICVSMWWTLLYVCPCGGHCYRCVYVVDIAIGVSMWWALL